MYKVNSNTAPAAFQGIFKRGIHEYQTAFSKSDYMKPKINLMKIKYRMSSQRPFIWNTLVSGTEMKIESFLLFKSKVKTKLHYQNNTIDFFLLNAI